MSGQNGRVSPQDRQPGEIKGVCVFLILFVYALAKVSFSISHIKIHSNYTCKCQ